MPIRGLHHVAFTVGDAGKSAEWYRDVLGFTVVADFEEGDGQRRKVVMTSAGLATRIGLVEHRGATAAAFDERITGLDHISFSFELGQLDDLLSTLDRYGVTYSAPTPSLMNADARVVVLRDPDNIQLEIYAEPIAR